MRGLFCSKTTPITERAQLNAENVPYPLSTCVVSGEKLGGMGRPYIFSYQGQEVRLCCKNCRGKFDKDPATYLKKLKEPKTGMGA